MRGMLGPSALRDPLKVCLKCGITFSKPAKVSWSQWEERVACSKRCSGERTASERLLGSIEKTDGPLNTQCWVWTGAKHPQGYGALIVKRNGIKRTWRAHRLSYEEFVGPAGDLFVCHRCDVRACINPEHLFLGTHADNMADRDRKGRNNAPKGPQKPDTKLDENAVREIRSGGSARDLAARFGVSISLIYKVRQGRAWEWLS
jgi:hypothetical protein